MNSITKTALTLSLLLPLAGCWDCWSTKKSEEQGEVATHGHTGEKASKCSHKGCTHDHSKDEHTKDSKVATETTTEAIENDEEVEIQSMDDDNMDNDMNNEDYSA